MKPYGLAISFIAVFWITASAVGQSISTAAGDGNDLLVFCSIPAGADACNSDISAVVAALKDGQPVDNHQACFTESVPNDRLTEITLDYLRSHPAQRQLKASAIVAAAMAEAFPCSR